MPLRFSDADLNGLLCVRPESSGLPVCVWTWSGGVLDEMSDVRIIVTPEPSLTDCPVCVVAIRPIPHVVEGPEIEQDDDLMRMLLFWIKLNRAVVEEYWWQSRLIWPRDFLAALEPVSVGEVLDDVGPD